MQLKREMLIKLAKKDTDLYPDNKEKQEIVFKRYKDFIIPLDIAEWIGLKPCEAMVKQKKIEQENFLKMIRPLKEIFAEETIAKFHSGKETELIEADSSK